MYLESECGKALTSYLKILRFGEGNFSCWEAVTRLQKKKKKKREGRKGPGRGLSAAGNEDPGWKHGKKGRGKGRVVTGR